MGAGRPLRRRAHRRDRPDGPRRRAADAGEVPARRSTSQLQWFVDSYSLVLAALLLPAGILADRYGRKRLLLLALTVFAVSSAACAYAGTPAALIATRALLGAAAAVILTVSLSMVAVLFPADEERPRRPPRCSWVAPCSGIRSVRYSVVGCSTTSGGDRSSS